MEDKEKIKAFIKKCSDEIVNQKISEGDYCIIIYAGRVITGQRWVKYIYKSISDFEFKIETDIKSIDEMSSIEFAMWMFD